MRCNGCGAELALGPHRCPLCGAESVLAAKPRDNAPKAPLAIEDYQENIRELRKKLKRLRDEGAEAV
jgi:predicted amidophosphoribosyltransferase